MSRTTNPNAVNHEVSPSQVAQMKQRQIPTGSFSYGNQYEDPYQQQRQEALKNQYLMNQSQIQSSVQQQIPQQQPQYQPRPAPTIEFKFPDLPSWMNTPPPIPNIPQPPKENPAPPPPKGNPQPQLGYSPGDNFMNTPPPSSNPVPQLGTRTGSNYQSTNSNNSTYSYNQAGTGYFNNSPLIKNNGYLAEGGLGRPYNSGGSGYPNSSSYSGGNSFGY